MGQAGGPPQTLSKSLQLLDCDTALPPSVVVGRGAKSVHNNRRVCPGAAVSPARREFLPLIPSLLECSQNRAARR